MSSFRSVVQLKLFLRKTADEDEEGSGSTVGPFDTESFLGVKKGAAFSFAEGFRIGRDSLRLASETLSVAGTAADAACWEALKLGKDCEAVSLGLSAGAAIKKAISLGSTDRPFGLSADEQGDAAASAN